MRSRPASPTGCAAPGSRSTRTPRDLDLPLRTAATCLAVERVAEAHQLRGLYP